MVGKPRLDMIEQKIARLERARGGDALAAWVATLSDDQLAELDRRLTAGEAPETVLKEMGLCQPTKSTLPT